MRNKASRTKVDISTKYQTYVGSPIGASSVPEQVARCEGSRFRILPQRPFEPEVLADGCTLAFDVTGEPIPDWAVGTDPESEPHGYERCPPDPFDGVNPPCPDDVFDE